MNTSLPYLYFSNAVEYVYKHKCNILAGCPAFSHFLHSLSLSIPPFSFPSLFLLFQDQSNCFLNFKSDMSAVFH